MKNLNLKLIEDLAVMILFNTPFVFVTFFSHLSYQKENDCHECCEIYDRNGINHASKHGCDARGMEGTHSQTMGRDEKDASQDEKEKKKRIDFRMVNSMLRPF